MSLLWKSTMALSQGIRLHNPGRSLKTVQCIYLKVMRPTSMDRVANILPSNTKRTRVLPVSWVPTTTLPEAERRIRHLWLDGDPVLWGRPVMSRGYTWADTRQG